MCSRGDVVCFDLFSFREENAMQFVFIRLESNRIESFQVGSLLSPDNVMLELCFVGRFLEGLRRFGWDEDIDGLFNSDEEDYSQFLVSR